MTPSELHRDEAKIREAAADCSTLQELSRKTGWSMHKLGLDVVRKSRTGKPREGVPCPKPDTKSKGKGAKE
jgi:hypothetical protein